MTVRRPRVRLPFRGFKDPTTGRALCVWCGTAVQGRRISWCSDACVEIYKIAKGDQNACRRFLRRTQRGMCQLCNRDARRTGWEADHTIPLVEGGTHTAANLRTLCCPCHRTVTKELVRRLAQKRRETEIAPRR